MGSLKAHSYALRRGEGSVRAADVDRVISGPERDDPGRKGDRRRVGQIHAPQFVAGPIQMRFHATKGQAKDFRDLLIRLPSRRP